MPAVPINYWAVLVCGIASIAWGSLYYGPLFGKIYIRMMGWENMDPARSAEMKKGMQKSYGLSFVGSLVMAWVLAHAIIFSQSYMGSSGLTAGLLTGLMSWLGFIATVTMGDILWGQKTWKFWTLTNGYQFIQLLIFGAILGVWR